MGKRVLAYDFGASSGRAMLGEFDGKTIQIEEIHRFSNDPVLVNGVLHWDVLRLLFEIKQGLVKAYHGGGFESMGIDTWGVDYGLLDRHGHLLGNPFHYRGTQFEGSLDRVFAHLPRERLYDITGIQCMDINTVGQLRTLREERPELLDGAKQLLFMPDLLCYFLTGERNTEYSMASTSQLLDARTKDFSMEILNAVGVSKDLFAPVIQPGSRVGRFSLQLQEELSLPATDVIAVAQHDTASAVVAVPAKEESFIYISCGTWSLMGTELAEPCINNDSARFNITNEGGYGGTIRFLKNIIGLWMIQEARRQWAREGTQHSYAQLEQQALAVPAFQSFVDPDHPAFAPQGNIPRRVREFCKNSGQTVPESVGGVMRCIYESLAMKYRHTFETMCSVTGKRYPVIHMVGGGTKDNLLCQMTADACKVPVVAGPIEATVFGNIAAQLIAAGEIRDVKQAREIIARSQNPVTYTPRDTAVWDEAYPRFQKVLKG